MDILELSKSRVPGMAATTYGDMLTSLLQEAREHPALNHVWLKNIAEQRYANPTGALRDFAYQYHAYASAFPMYLKIVVDKLVYLVKQYVTYWQFLDHVSLSPGYRLQTWSRYKVLAPDYAFQ
ncbi:MAG: hypothetical protein PVI97_17110, partial [Candidatus Thiodiazotropha sp.]